MKRGIVSELSAGDTLRCGRCADILPDETLTFCKSCGVPFSQVHPTDSFELISERTKVLLRRRNHIKKWAFAGSAFASTWGLYGLFFLGSQHFQIQNLKPRTREVQFYIKDFNELPLLDAQVKRESIFMAQRAFEDHFAIDLKDISIHEDSWPEELSSVYRETSHQIAESNMKEVETLFSVPAMRLSFWEGKVFPAMNLVRVRDPHSPLKVVISNLPIFAGFDKNSSVETRHLAGAGLVSGLGHPALVMISTYRLHNEVPMFHLDRPPTENLSEKARFLGEFVIAHELGHALLALADYITPPEAYPSTGITLSQAQKKSNPNGNTRGSRGIASLNSEDVTQCLMHTDLGGGFHAWDTLKKRQLGVSSNCSAYKEITHAFTLRLEAIELLKLGEREDAEKLHARAIEMAKPLGQNWLVSEWKNEHKLFLSYFKRLWQGLFVIQSKE